MDAISELTKISFSSLFLSAFLVLTGAKAVLSLLEWFVEKLGLETGEMKRRRLDRARFEDIQRELGDSVKKIQDLTRAQREILADRINEKYKCYISLHGIPEDEVEEFTDLHTAYKGLGGNHSGDAKYEYCRDHLPVIPVETKLKPVTADRKESV